ncbi:hypothetical protein P154DRAFT_152634 [Amniculicola lignicola CBS 123094]|uniref:Uncharacterized protein n=1 Tax=Amniculicola lignicola CBS 123094 TaxID=1392246 RepID=A0A6A5W0S2_9PLEO|nr:hypothetical protein P154DRAFT_152634 [Amniculicola lignicola CBS 123094]
MGWSETSKLGSWRQLSWPGSDERWCCGCWSTGDRPAWSGKWKRRRRFSAARRLQQQRASRKQRVGDEQRRRQSIETPETMLAGENGPSNCWHGGGQELELELRVQRETGRPKAIGLRAKGDLRWLGLGRQYDVRGAGVLSTLCTGRNHCLRRGVDSRAWTACCVERRRVRTAGFVFRCGALGADGPEQHSADGLADGRGGEDQECGSSKFGLKARCK